MKIWRDTSYEKRQFAKKLRKNPTPAEKTLFKHLRKKQLGVRFRRQVIMFKWIVDFWCPKWKLIVEVDGSSHDYKLEQDNFRDMAFEDCDIRVLRIKNEEVFQDINKVIRKIQKYRLPYT